MQKYVISEEEMSNFIGCIIDTFEDWLEEKGITPEDIPNEDREQSEGGGAIIYGDDYGFLQTEMESILSAYKQEPPELVNLQSTAVQEQILQSHKAIKQIRSSDSLSEQEQAAFIETIITSTAKSLGIDEKMLNEQLKAMDGPEVNDIKEFVGIADEDYPGKIFKGIDFSNMDLSSRNFRDCTFINCHGTEVNFSGCDFGGCVLQGCVFNDCSFAKTDFSLAEGIQEKDNFINTIFEQCDMSKCSLDYVFFAENVKFNQCKLSESSFMHSVLCQGSFMLSDLSGCFFEGANMQGCDLRDCICSNSFFTHANLTNVNLDHAVCDFCVFDSSCMKYVSAEDTNLEYASFEHADLLKFELKYVKAALSQEAKFDSKISCCETDEKGGIHFVDIPNEISFESLKADKVQKDQRDDAAPKQEQQKQQNQGIDRE